MRIDALTSAKSEKESKIILKIAKKRNEIKVQLIWEGHKNLRNLPYGFDVY